MRRVTICIIAVLIVLCIPTVCCALASPQEQLGEYDFSELDELLGDFEYEGGFTGIAQDILLGKLKLESRNFLEALPELLLKSCTKYLPSLLIFTAACIIISAMRTAAESGGTAMTLAGNAVLVLLLFSSFFSVMTMARGCMEQVSAVTEAAVPIISAALLASGAATTASVMQPDSVLLSQAVGGVILHGVFPAVVMLSVLIFADSLLPKSKLSGVATLMKSGVTWVLGVLFTVFAAVISIKGLAAASYDGISLRTVRYAINSGVPLVGAAAGEGVNLVIASCSLVKNAIGLASLLLLLVSAGYPLLSVGIYSLLLKALAAVTAPFAPSEVLSALARLSDAVKLTVAALTGTLIAAVIIFGIAIGAGNAF